MKIQNISNMFIKYFLVVLASYDSVQTILNQEQSNVRDMSGIMIDRNFSQPNLGILFNNGESWDKNRRWTVRNLRPFGFGKSSQLESAVNVEVAEMFSELEKNEELCRLILPVQHSFLIPISRIMYKMVAGPGVEIDREKLAEMNEQTALMEKASGITGTVGAFLTIYFPLIRFVFPEWTGRNVQLSCRSVMQSESRVSKKQVQKLYRNYAGFSNAYVIGF
jgi:hypothetical protein